MPGKPVQGRWTRDRVRGIRPMSPPASSNAPGRCTVAVAANPRPSFASPGRPGGTLSERRPDRVTSTLTTPRKLMHSDTLGATADTQRRSVRLAADVAIGATHRCFGIGPEAGHAVARLGLESPATLGTNPEPRRAQVTHVVGHPRRGDPPERLLGGDRAVAMDPVTQGHAPAGCGSLGATDRCRHQPIDAPGRPHAPRSLHSRLQSHRLAIRPIQRSPLNETATSADRRCRQRQPASHGHWTRCAAASERSTSHGRLPQRMSPPAGRRRGRPRCVAHPPASAPPFVHPARTGQHPESASAGGSTLRSPETSRHAARRRPTTRSRHSSAGHATDVAIRGARLHDTKRQRARGRSPSRDHPCGGRATRIDDGRYARTRTASPHGCKHPLGVAESRRTRRCESVGQPLAMPSLQCPDVALESSDIRIRPSVDPMEITRIRPPSMRFGALRRLRKRAATCIGLA